MAHPTMFDAADPYLLRLRAICLALPEADEKVAHGRPTFFTTKVFAYYGGSVKGDHDPAPYARSLLFVPDAAERPALLGDPRVFEPAYLAPYGWLGLNFTPTRDVTEVDWDEVAELVDTSFRRTAPARLVKTLDARG